MIDTRSYTPGGRMVGRLLIAGACLLVAPSVASALRPAGEPGHRHDRSMVSGCGLFHCDAFYSPANAVPASLTALPKPSFRFTEGHMWVGRSERLVLKTFTVVGTLSGERVALARESDRVSGGKIHWHSTAGSVTFTNVNEIINAFGRERIRLRLAGWLGRIMTVLMQRGAPRGVYEVEEEHCFAPTSALEYTWEFGIAPGEAYVPC
jgi:hypothetical protein